MGGAIYARAHSGCFENCWGNWQKWPRAKLARMGRNGKNGKISHKKLDSGVPRSLGTNPKRGEI